MKFSGVNDRTRLLLFFTFYLFFFIYLDFGILIFAAVFIFLNFSLLYFCKCGTSAFIDNKCQKQKSEPYKTILKISKIGSFFYFFPYSSLFFMENPVNFSEEAADNIEKNHVFDVYEQISEHFSETRYDLVHIKT
jgi:hypothetical protein